MSSKKNPYKIIPLILITKWFDLVAADIKSEEYREITPYWARRLERFFVEPAEQVRFFLGYQRNRPMVQKQFVKIEKRTGNPEWGAEPGKIYYVITVKPN